MAQSRDIGTEILEGIRELKRGEFGRACESLRDGSNPGVAATLDPEGIEIAMRGDSEISEGLADSISHEEFLRQTSEAE